MQKENERKAIKRISIISGLCVIAYVAIQNVLSIIIYLTPLGKLYETDLTMRSVVTIFLSVLGLMLPFAVGGALIGRKTGSSVFNFGKPVSTKLMLAAVPLGFFVCLIGNYITGIFVTYMETLGIALSSPEYPTPSDLPDRIIYSVSIAVVPALVEEFAIRGAVLQPLRKYGDKFAILVSSLLFAIIHGNLIQAPFALIAGIGIGYAVCITNSVWTGVLIHFCNNFFSVFVSFLIEDIQDETMLDSVYLKLMIVLYAISITGSVIFVILKGRRKLMPSFTALSEGKKFRTFVFTLPMIITILVMLYLTSNYIDFA